MCIRDRNILGGMDTATSGKVLVDGAEISKYRGKKLIQYRREDIGFVFQFYNLDVYKRQFPDSILHSIHHLWCGSNNLVGMDISEGLWTVSYTHLDVYKRQTLDTGFQKNTAKKGTGRTAGNNEWKAGMIHVGAVSYTHLQKPERNRGRGEGCV